VRLIRQRILAGYRPAGTPAVRASVLADEGWRSLGAFAMDEAAFKGGLAVVLTTFVGRGEWRSQTQPVSMLAEQLRSFRAAWPDVPVFAVIAMQWQADQEPEAHARLRQCESLWTAAPSARLLCISVEAGRKLISLNCAISLAERAGTRAILWIDDDVQLSDGAIATLWKTFKQGNYRGAVGPTKIGRPRKTVSSKLVHRFKQRTTPATNYPHGCCLLVDLDVVRGGIPWEYASDDGYVCFELLRPESKNPLELLKISPDAVCFHETGAESWYDNFTRIRRMQLNHHIMIARYPDVVGRYYFRAILFRGLWPIADRADAGEGRRMVRWWLKLLHFMLFLSVGIELILRGLIGRQLRQVPWGGSPRLVPSGREAGVSPQV